MSQSSALGFSSMAVVTGANFRAWDSVTEAIATIKSNRMGSAFRTMFILLSWNADIHDTAERQVSKNLEESRLSQEFRRDNLITGQRPWL
jgi:hypothetical protein